METVYCSKFGSIPFSFLMGIGMIADVSWPALLSSVVAGGAGMAGILKYLDKTSISRRYGEILNRNERRIAHLEQEHSRCMAQHAEMAQELGQLRGRLQEIENKISRSG